MAGDSFVLKTRSNFLKISDRCCLMRYFMYKNEWNNYQAHFQCSRVLAEKNDVQHVGVTMMLRIDIDANAKLIHAPRC